MSRRLWGVGGCWVLGALSPGGSWGARPSSPHFLSPVLLCWCHAPALLPGESRDGRPTQLKTSHQCSSPSTQTAFLPNVSSQNPSYDFHWLSFSHVTALQPMI